MSKLFLSTAALTMLALASGCAPSSPTESIDWSSAAAGEDAGVKRGDVVISAIYGGGGQANAPFVKDYIELFNRSNSTISLDGWSVQTTAHDQNIFGNVIPLTGSLAPGKYYLIAGASQGAVGAELPTPVSVTSDVDLPPDKGKVALISNTTALNCEGGAVPRCPFSKTVDFVGYGTANDFEGAIGQVGTLSATKAAARKDNGCLDKDDNANDFVVGDPKPRTSETAANVCPGPAPPDAGRPDTGAPRPDAAGPPPKVNDPPLGTESPFDAGKRRDAGGTPTGAGASASDCNVTTVGASSLERDVSILGGALGLMVVALAILRRRAGR